MNIYIALLSGYSPVYEELFSLINRHNERLSSIWQTKNAYANYIIKRIHYIKLVSV